MPRKNTDLSGSKGKTSRERFIENNRKANEKLTTGIAVVFCILFLLRVIYLVIQALGGLIHESVMPFITPDNLRAALGVTLMIIAAYLICGFLFGFKFEDGD